MPSKTGKPNQIIPDHLIDIRILDGNGEFFNRKTGEKFIPRGYNYVRVAPMSKNNSGLWHSTFNQGYYDPEKAEKSLQLMHEYGFNVVRVFVDCCRPGLNAGDPKGGISKTYLANIIDFLNKAKASEIFVLLILDGTPADGHYDEVWQSCCNFYDANNLRILTPGGHYAKRRFDQDFIRALIKSNAPTEIIFAYDLTNEVSFSADQPPLNLKSGFVTTANKKRYDLSSAADKQKMMDENLVYWIDQQRSFILDVDPTALVSVSFPAINSGPTTVNPWTAINQSTADFIDLHTYLGWGLNLDNYMKRFGLIEESTMPIILGEFGSSSKAFPSASNAADAIVEWQIDSCNYGFDGWLYWTWDTYEQTDLFNGLSESGVINKLLAPIYRPDPCQMK